jgi:DNA-binding response OmpR family regulator
MIYDDSMHSESSMPAEPHPAYTPEQLAAIQSLDEPSTTTPKPALSKTIALPTIAAGVLVACAIYKFLNPTLAWIITFFPGIVRTPHRLILIEDEEHLAQGLLFNLAAEGYRTHHESDGDAALAYLLAPPPNPSPPSSSTACSPAPTASPSPAPCATPSASPPSSCSPPAPAPRTSSMASKPAPTTTSPNPSNLNILLVRIKSLLRRTAWQSPETTPSSPIVRHPAAQRRDLLLPTESPPTPTPSTTAPSASTRLELIAPNRTTHLTVMEADLLRYLTDRAGQIVSRKQILEQVWRVHEDTDTRAIDNFIVRLRRYIEDDPANPAHLTTVRGIGYRFLPNP